MAYTVTEGTGTSFAADVVAAAAAPAATQKIPYVKVDLGAAGASLPLAAGANTAVNSLPITRATDDQVNFFTAPKVTQVTSAGAYTAGNAVGGKITLTNVSRASGRAVCLTNINILDKDNQKAALTILFFDADPTAATITDRAAFVFGTDNVKCVGKVDVPAANYTTINAQAVANVDNLWKVMQPAATANLWAVVVTTGTPTYASTSSIVVEFGFEQA